MTYEQLVSSRQSRLIESRKSPRCAGCCQTFESYGITEDEGFKAYGKIYCNADCHDYAESRAIEEADFISLADEY